MNKNVFSFELDGKRVLGFDTGLDPRSFAQAKMADCITQRGAIVFPDGAVDPWQPGGVTEYIAAAGADLQKEGSMVIWGPDFPGEELASVICEGSRQDEALDAIRFWLKAAAVMGEALDDASIPGPSGAYIVTANTVAANAVASNAAAGGSTPPGKQYPAGTVFFPPARLLKRTLDAAGDKALLEAGHFCHPDLKGGEAVSFCAGAMLYRVLCGSHPYSRGNQDEMRQDIREGVFTPPALAKPGLSPEMSLLIAGAISPVPRKSGASPRPGPGEIAEALGPPFSKKASSWIESLSEEEIAKILAEQERYGKKTASAVKARRFLVRYKAAIAASLAAIVVLLFIVNGMVRRQAERPTTKGMTPLEVSQAYYSAIDVLDSDIMEACVTGKAGKDDINMVVNLFVITKVRQGYEMRDRFMTAQKWVDAGQPLTYDTIFGITDLRMGIVSLGETNAVIEADYVLWIPGATSTEDYTVGISSGEQAAPPPIPPDGISTKDRLDLFFEKGQWRITNIERASRPL